MTTPAPDIEILRPGTYTDIHGQVVSFGAAEMEQIVASYDAAAHPAPLVIGHPKLDHPAWGWVGKLRVEGDVLLATPEHLEPAFAEAVRAKRYRKVSPSFYPPNARSSPTPGRWSLKHVGFLGATAPAMKGLGTVSFAASDDEAAITIIPQEPAMSDTPNPDQEVAFAEREGAIVTREAALSNKETDLVAREATLIANEKKAIHDGHVAFAEAQIDAGKLAPAGKDLVIGLLDTLASADAVSFGEVGELPPVDAFRRLFDGAAPVVAFGEAAPADRTELPVEQSVEQSPESIADRALAFAESEKAEGREITVQAAVRHVMRDSAA